jgi:hypothetical protein
MVGSAKGRSGFEGRPDSIMGKLTEERHALRFSAFLAM